MADEIVEVPNLTIFTNSNILGDEYVNEMGMPLDLGPKRDSLYIVIPITVVYGLIFFTGVIGNISTCIVIARNKSMHTATNNYLFNLAISDLLLLVTGLPQEMHSIWSRYPYVFGEVFCVLRGLASETSANATVLTITCFTVERYVAICHPFLSHTMSKVSRAVKLILAVWIIALCFAIPQALQFGLIHEPVTLCIVKKTFIEHSFELSTFFFFVVPMSVITVLYALIGLQLRSSSMMKRDRRSTMSCKNPSQCTNSEHRKSCRHIQGNTKRVIKMLVAVVAAFFICWAPFHAQRLVAIYGIGATTENQHPLMFNIYVVITYISGILYYVSTTINPLLYHIMSNKFREAFKETFWKCCSHGRSRSESQRRSTYTVLGRNATMSGVIGGTNHNSTRCHGDANSQILANQESTDSGMSVTQRHSQDCMCFSNASGVNESQIRKDTPDTTMTEYSVGSNVYQHSLLNKMDLRTESFNQETISNTISPYRKNILKRKTNRFLRAFRCLAKKTLDDSIQLSKNSSPIQDEKTIDHNDHRESYCMVPCNVSNSSLKDVEQGALEDELTAYMKEIQSRELAMR